MTTRLSATGAGQVGPAEAMRRLLANAPDTTLLALSAGLTVGVALSPAAHAQGLTVNPAQANTYTLSPDSNPITFGSATNITTTAGDAVEGAPYINWTITNQGTLSGATDGIAIKSIIGAEIAGMPSENAMPSFFAPPSAGVTITNQRGGLITGGNYGIELSGSAGTVTNAGRISGSYGGVYLASGGSVTNRSGGSITSQDMAVGIRNGGSVTNRAGGTISGAIGVYGGGSNPLAVNNAGSITGTSGEAVLMLSGGDVANRAGGEITGSYGAVRIANGTGTVTNAGTISATGTTSAIALFSGGSVTNRRGGTITGGANAVYTYGGAATVTNAGTITGATDSVLFAGSGANVLTLRTGSVLNGNAVGSTAQGATNALDLQGTGIANNAFIDFNTLDVQASGVWTLNNTSTFSSAATIDSGNLQVGDATHTTAQLASPTLTVNSGATLSGYGTIIGAVSNNGGAVAPAGLGSALTVNGSFVQSPTGTLIVTIAPSGQNSFLQVNGTAQLGGTLDLVPQGTNFLVGTRYTVVTTTGGVTGDFASVSPFGTLFLTPVLSVSADDAFVTLTQTPLTSVAITPNQVATAGGLDSLLSSGNAGAAQMAIDQSQPAAIRSQLTRFSGEAYTGFQTAELNSGAAFLGQITQSLYRARLGFAAGGTQAQASGATGGRVQLAANGASPNMLPDPDAQRWSVWVNGYGQSSAVPGNGNASQFNGTAAGTTAGADYQVNRNLLLGAAVGFTSTSFSVNNSGAQGQADDGQFALYANYSTGPAYVAGSIGYSHAEGTMLRDISLPGLPGQARGSISGNQVLGGAETGYDFKLPNGIVATPFAGLQLAAYTQNAMVESTGGPLALAVQQASASSVVSQFGGRFATDLHLAGLTISTQAELGWAHEFASTARSITASFVGAPSTPFTVSGAQAGRDHAIVGFGVATAITQNTSLFVRYDGAIDGSDNSNALSGGIRMVW